MKLAPWLLIATLFLFMPAFATAAVDGNALLQKCEPIEKLYEDPASLSSKEASGVVYCLGYLDGFIELFFFQVQSKILPTVPYCLPHTELPKKEIAKAIVDYLKKHPENLDKLATYNIFTALRQAYPCNQEEETQENPENKISSEQ